jgi:hypothetical protein
MAKFIIIPIILVISGGLGILLLSYVRQKTDLRRALRATPLRRCAELSAAALPVPAKVTGEVVVAPRGLLRAPISGVVSGEGAAAWRERERADVAHHLQDGVEGSDRRHRRHRHDHRSAAG